MNSAINKSKRKTYVQTLKQYLQSYNTTAVIWMDESNCNLFITRKQGRSLVGARANYVRCTSKGPNVHIIAGLWMEGFVHYERRRGSNTKQSVHDFMQNLVAAAVATERGRRVETIVIVLDNAREHLGIEDRDFSAVDDGKNIVFLKLGPYSHLLNPIELAWSQVKSNIKRTLKTKLRHLENPPPTLTQGEHKLRVMEKAIDDAMVAPFAPDLFQATGFISHVSRYYDVCEDLQDLVELT